MENFLPIALQYHAAGLHVLPVKEDKTPDMSSLKRYKYSKTESDAFSWKRYQYSQNESDVRSLFAKPVYGIAILTGISGLEVVDVDVKYDLTGQLEQDLRKANEEVNEPEGHFENLTVQRTRSGGLHLMYRCANPDGNKKLAQRLPVTPDEEGTKPVLIETRGVGGYVVVAPTPGYSVVIGSLTNIPLIKQSTRDNLIRVCQAFNQVVMPVNVKTYSSSSLEDEISPWQDYNSRNSPIDVLKRYGWTVVFTQGERIFLKRPGNTNAKTSGNYHTGKRVFVAHTTSTPLPAGVGLNAFAIYAYLQHGGDFRAAANALSAEGYGSRRLNLQNKPKVLTPEEAKQKEDELIAFVRSTRFDIHKPITQEKATLTVMPPESGTVFNVGCQSTIGAVVGQQKSGKSFLLACIVASALGKGEQRCYFSYKADETDRIVFFDTEQSEYFYKLSQSRIYEMAGLKTNQPRYEAYHLRRLTVEQRVKAVETIVREGDKPKLIVIDGVVDLCPDFNNERESAQTVEFLMRLSDETGAMLITVLHLTKGLGFMRGHLGTALQNKCDFSIEVAVDKTSPGWFNVTSRDSRFTPFPKFSFLRDSKTGLLAGFNNSLPVLKSKTEEYIDEEEWIF